MPKLAVQTSVPPGGPDTLLPGDPPGTAFLPATARLVLRLAMASGAASVRPYSWSSVLGKWTGIGFDAGGAGAAAVGADASAGGGSAEGRYDGVGEGRWWCLVREAGAGSPSVASLEAT